MGEVVGTRASAGRENRGMPAPVGIFTDDVAECKPTLAKEPNVICII